MKKPTLAILGTLICFSVHAQEQTTKPASTFFQQGDETLKKAQPGYNSPAAIKIDRSWNMFVTGSWIYWYAGEGGLDLATTMNFRANEANTVIPITSGSKTVSQNFEYKSGYKVGLGSTFGKDDWILRLDLTNLHQQTNTSASAPNLGTSTGALLVSNWFYQTSGQSQSPAFGHLNSKWDLKLDWLDLTLSRPFYQAPRATISPFASLRASWIKQSLTLRGENGLNVTPPQSATHSYNHSHSWGIGPRLGMEGHFLLGAGFRIQGDVGASVLYTRYTTLSHKEDPIVTNGPSVSFHTDPLGTIRPIIEANLGAGWGWYFAKNNAHLDLSATYDFNYLWSQNMMRAFNDWTFIGSGGSANDLYLHGVTITTTFHF